MATAQPTVYLSICSRDLHSRRGQLNQSLKKRGVSLSQDPPASLDARGQIESRLCAIAASDLVVHVAGRASGPEPSPEALAQALSAWDQASPGFSARLGLKAGDRISYTQLEARLAYALGKTVYPILLAGNFPYDAHPKEDFASGGLQHAHRKVLEGLCSETQQARTPIELDHVIRHLDLPGAKQSPKPAARRTLVLAGSLILVAGGWFAWQRFGSPFHLSMPPRELALSLVEHTVVHDQVGVITTADQRFASAEATVAEQARISASALRNTLARWAKEICADPKSSDYDRALAEFVNKDYAKAEASALRAAPKGTEQEVDKAAPESHRSLIVALCAQMAQYKYGAACETTLRPGFNNSHYSADAKTAAQQRHDSYWRRSLPESIQKGPGMGGGAWHVMLSESQGANGGRARGFTYPPDDVIALKSWVASGNAARGKLEDAILLARHLPEEYQKIHGREHSSVAIAIENYASILLGDGQFEAAANQLAHQPKVPVPAGGESGPAMNYYQSNLISSRLSLATGDLSHAENQARFAVTERERLLGREHPEFAEALSQLALALQALGKSAEAEKCQQQALDIQEKCFGLRSLPSTIGLRRLALIWQDLGKLEKANTSLRECLRVQGQILREEDLEMAETHAALAISDYESGYNDDAIEHDLKAVELMQRSQGASALRLAPVYFNLARALWIADRFKEAWSYAMQSLTMLEAAKNLNTPALARTLELVGRLKDADEQHTEAESYFRRTIRIHMTCMNMGHPEYPMTMHALARNLCQQGRIDEALGMHKEADKLLKQSLPPDHWMNGVGIKYHAITLHQAGRFNEADELLAESKRILDSTLGKNHWRTANATYHARQWEAEKELRALLLQRGESPDVLAEKLRRLQEERARQEQEKKLPDKTTTMERGRRERAHPVAAVALPQA